VTAELGLTCVGVSASKTVIRLSLRLMRFS
jgi:hypothetical protein